MRTWRSFVNKQEHPVTIRIAGTVAPLYREETIFTGPVGRLLTVIQATIAMPGRRNNGGGKIALAPGVVAQTADIVSCDFVGAFPENYQGKPDVPDPKFDFAP